MQPKIDPTTQMLDPELLDAFEPPKLKIKQQEDRKATKAEMALWSPRRLPMRLDWVTVSKEGIARKRVDLETVTVLIPGKEYRVAGRTDLSDKYEEYLVRNEAGRYSCSCQGHAYGDTRSLCSHAIACAITDYVPDQIKASIPSSSSDRLTMAEYRPMPQDLPVPLSISPELIQLVEEQNSQNLPLILDEWEVHLAPRVWQINWFPEADALTPGEFRTSLDRMSEDHEDLITDEIKQSMIEDYKHRQTVQARLALITEMPSPSRWDLPEQFSELRADQWTALQQTCGAWCSGKKFVFIDAPTGAGKSVIGNIILLEWTGVSVYGPGDKMDAKGFIVVTSRDLQDQMHKDFKQQVWFAMIKGRGNYPTANFPSRYYKDKSDAEMAQLQRGQDANLWERHLDCSDCEYASRKHCRYCDPPNYNKESTPGAPCLGRCPYRQELRKLIKRPVGMTNSAYLLRSCNSMAWGQFDDRSVLVIDECDTLESVFMGWVTVEVPEKRLPALGTAVGRPEYKTPGESANVDWFGWAGRAKRRISEIILRREGQVKGEIPVGGPTGEPGEESIKVTADMKNVRRDQKWWEKLADNLDIFMESLKRNDPWIYDGYQTNKETNIDSGPIVFKPVKIDMFTHEKLFKNFRQVVGMTATAISFDQMARDLGIPADQLATITIPRTFDPKRCPIFAVPVADNSMKHQEESWPLLSAAICQVLLQNQEHRIVIHAVSYQQSNRVYQLLKQMYPTRAILTHYKGNDGSKKLAIKQYMETPGAVLITPAMARGADFKGDLCRVQIILKVPFGNLGDKQISARLYGTHDGRQWYATNTIRELVQMTGRNMRSDEDWGFNYILDRKFLDLWREWEFLFPEWWRASLTILRPGEF